MKAMLLAALLCGVSVDGFAQASPSLDVKGKLRFHAEDTFGLSSFAASGARAGFQQLIDSPTEWGQGSGAYGKRTLSAIATTGVRGTIALGLDSALHQDPRYFRSTSRGFWRRTAHAVRGIVVTRTDGGGETFATWRIGSAYGASFVANQWYPDRLNTVSRGFANGSALLGFDIANNMAAEFWPDVKRKLLRRKP